MMGANGLAVPKVQDALKLSGQLAVQLELVSPGNWP
jgi:hypothetical protein